MGDEWAIKQDVMREKCRENLAGKSWQAAQQRAE
jgi:hypothetical protein